MTQDEKECNAAIRRSARRGKFSVVERTSRDRETGRFVASEDMNAAIRARGVGVPVVNTQNDMKQP